MDSEKSLVPIFFILFLALQGATAVIPEFLKEDFYCIYTHTALTAREVVDEPVTADKVNYYLFTRSNPENYSQVDPADAELLSTKNVSTVFLIHGWTEDREVGWYEDLKNAFLKRDEEYQVVQVDWSDPAGQFYIISSYNTKDVGRIIGDFIVGLHRNYSIPLDNFLLVGHSLGGQVSGFAGRRVQELTSEKLPRIIALDPAGPLFIARPETERLNPNDAKVVEVIHTDGGTFGFKGSCGTVDFFPNGGSSQPGCKSLNLLNPMAVTEAVVCDHHRSWMYFIEAVSKPQEFFAGKCDSWSAYEEAKCQEDRVAMGDLSTTEKGNFYLETSYETPFAEKKERSVVGKLLPFV